MNRKQGLGREQRCTPSSHCLMGKREAGAEQSRGAHLHTVEMGEEDKLASKVRSKNKMCSLLIPF